MRITMLQNHTEPRTSKSGTVINHLYTAGGTYEVDEALGGKFLEEGKGYRDGEEPPTPEPLPLRGSDGRRPTLIGGKRFYNHVVDDPAPQPPKQTRGEDGRRPTLAGGKRIFGVVEAPEVADAPSPEPEGPTLSTVVPEGHEVSLVIKENAGEKKGEGSTFVKLPELNTGPVDNETEPEAPEPEED